MYVCMYACMCMPTCPLLKSVGRIRYSLQFEAPSPHPTWDTDRMHTAPTPRALLSLACSELGRIVLVFTHLDPKRTQNDGTDSEIKGIWAVVLGTLEVWVGLWGDVSRIMPALAGVDISDEAPDSKVPGSCHIPGPNSYRSLDNDQFYSPYLYAYIHSPRIARVASTSNICQHDVVHYLGSYSIPVP